ncbi:MAG: CDP-alcohol phosphatidyltransferase family protein [Candidatus Magasanikbacteria bacterium]
MKHEVTANTVTVVRGILVLPVIILAGFGFSGAAFILHLVSWWGDAVDGSVARERQRCGYVDNRDLGEYLDPMVDKAAWVAEAMFLPFAAQAELRPTWVVVIAIAAMCVLVLIEVALGIVRWQDYHANTKQTTDAPKLNLGARWSGKVKMVLEVAGLSTLILTSSDEATWCVHVWAWALAAAMPLASLSLLQKIWSRKAIVAN